MATIYLTRFLLLACFLKIASSLRVSQELYAKNEKMCLDFSKNPYFDIDLMIAKPWRIYYTWNIHIERKCMDMVFKNATPAIINRFYNDMSEYLEVQPVWEAATIYGSMGAAAHEILLFADPLGTAGVFTGVPNIRRSNIPTPERYSIPIIKFFIKLFNGGKYLLMFDCKIGVGSLSAKEIPYRSELAKIALTLGLSGGSPACIQDTRRDEQSHHK